MESEKVFLNYQNDFAKLCKQATNAESKDRVGRLVLHAKRVIDWTKTIAESLNLSEHESNMAAIIALFHDIGRLAPYLKQNNENPPETDHAEAGVSYLKSSNLMNELDEITQNIVFESIRLHNKQEIPHKTPESIVFYAKLLRDADKLDSWQTTVEHLINRNPKPNTALDIALNDTRILSPTICNTILDNKIPSRSELKTFADFKLFQLSWVFDLNFKKSFQLLNQKQYIRTIYESLPKNNSVIDIYRMVRIYVENKIW